MNIINGNYREYRLDNGLVVALQNTPTQTISAKLRVNYGTSHEREGEEGLAHFLEHCLVTGGSLRYTPVEADIIRDSFGYSNAHTNTGRTNFVGQFLSEDLGTWLNYISDHVFRPRFDLDRVNGERQRVLREIADGKSNPTYQSMVEFNKIFYGNHPKGRNSLGKEEVVEKATQEIMRGFHSRGYHPNNMDLIIVGGLPENIEELVKNYFDSLSTGENTRRDFPRLKQLGEKIVLYRGAPEISNLDNPKDSSAHIFLYYLGPINEDEDAYPVSAMNYILGVGTNSMLFQNVGLKKGLAYRIGTNASDDYNAGVLGINASVPATRIEESLAAIFEEIQRMETQRIDEKVIERIRRLSKYNLAEAFESNEGHVRAIESKLDEDLTPERFMERWNRVNAQRVFEVANRYLPDREKGQYILYIRDPLMK